MGVTFLRTVLLYLFVVIAVRLMGKRQIGELQPSEFVVTILISELAAVPMQDLGIPLFNGIVPILTLIILEILMSFFMLKSIKFRALYSGKPSILIQNGVILQKELKRLQFTVDDLMEELRLGGVATLEEVDCAILETNGKLSIFQHRKFSPLTPNDMNIAVENKTIPIPIIVDGRLISHNMPIAKIGIDEIMNKIQSSDLESIKDVFFMYSDLKQKLTLIRKENLK